MDSRLKRAAFRGALIGITAAAAIASAATFNLFSPANGILKGNPSTYITTAAAGGDVIGLWSGTCNNTTYLRGDGACAAPPGTGGGTVSSVGLTMPSGFSVGGSPVTGSSVLAVTTTLSGVLKGTGSGFTTAGASDIVGLFSGCTGTDYLGADNACHVAGTVISVALSAPSVFAVGGTPVTGTGTLALTFATGQAANEVLASPNGTTGAVGLRTLVGADIPAINVAGTGNGGITGSLPFASLTITSSNVIGLWTGTCSSSTFLRGDGSCVSPGGGGTVTSVGLTAPSVFTVGGTPVTGSGVLAVTFAGGQTANSFLATPNGTAGAVGLRTIVAGDLPSSITSNTSGNAGTASAANSSPAQCSSGQYATGVSTVWAANCAQVAYSQLSGAPTVPSAANPSASVGLSTVNGSASTWMRSDAAPALSQSISPVWTGQHIFTGTAYNTTGVEPTYISIGNEGANPALIWYDSSGGANSKLWDLYADGSVLHGRAINDANSVADEWLNVARSGVAITTISVGNTTDNPAITFHGATSVVNGGGGTALSVGLGTDTSNAIGINSKGSGGTTTLVLNSTGVEALEIVNNQSGSTVGGVPSGALGAYNVVGEPFYFGNMGVVIGSATGGSQGSGSLNAHALFVNGVAVLTSAGAGVSKIAAAGISGTGGGCTVVGGAGIASCSPNGTGQWQMNFTTSFFTTTPICNVTGNNSSVANNGVLVSSPGTAAFDALAFTTNTGSLLSSSDFYVICVGT